MSERGERQGVRGRRGVCVQAQCRRQGLLFRTPTPTRVRGYYAARRRSPAHPCSPPPPPSKSPQNASRSVRAAIAHGKKQGLLACAGRAQGSTTVTLLPLIKQASWYGAGAEHVSACIRHSTPGASELRALQHGGRHQRLPLPAYRPLVRMPQLAQQLLLQMPTDQLESQRLGRGIRGGQAGAKGDGWLPGVVKWDRELQQHTRHTDVKTQPSSRANMCKRACAPCRSGSRGWSGPRPSGAAPAGAHERRGAAG